MRPPETISVGAVVRALEPLKFVECLHPDRSQCLVKGPCRLTAVFREALAARLAVRDRTTLADVTEGNRKLVQPASQARVNSATSQN